MKKINFSTWAVVFLVCIILVLLLVNKCQLDELTVKDNMIDAITDTLKVARNKDSSATATIIAFQTSSTKSFLELRTRDSTITRLQNLVSEYKTMFKHGGTATTISTSTNVKTSTPTTVTYRDTFYKDSLVYIYPEYSDSFNLNGWVIGKTIANKDSIRNTFSIKDELDLVVGFKGRIPTAQLTSRNPFVTITELRSVNFNDIPKQKRLGLSLNVGYGGVFIDNKVRSGPYGGIGLSYNLWLIR